MVRWFQRRHLKIMTDHGWMMELKQVTQLQLRKIKILCRSRLYKWLAHYMQYSHPAFPSLLCNNTYKSVFWQGHLLHLVANITELFHHTYIQRGPRSDWSYVHTVYYRDVFKETRSVTMIIFWKKIFFLKSFVKIELSYNFTINMFSTA